MSNWDAPRKVKITVKDRSSGNRGKSSSGAYRVPASSGFRNQGVGARPNNRKLRSAGDIRREREAAAEYEEQGRSRGGRGRGGSRGRGGDHNRNANPRGLDNDDGNYVVPTVGPALGRLIQQGRQAKDLTQKQLAQRIEEKIYVVQSYENGTAQPNQQILGKLERTLGIKLRGTQAAKQGKRRNRIED
eukprot:TRINITY_DN802_c1_g1_i1.p1 TRINITY_DN802_c1_g1~~TRINITY_DN802_c1_g1_i1.p1  ORF type:complete len:201 (+),score=50.24 TRINITY_DN802_c1_g1_i1:42-605(+)